MDRTIVDCIVIGCGPAGASTALTLNACGINTLVVEQQSNDPAERRFAVGESLPPQITPILHSLGLYEHLQNRTENGYHLESFAHVSSWGSEELNYSNFIFNMHQSGWHLDRKQFDCDLIDQVKASGINILTKTKFIKANKNQDKNWEVEIFSEETKESKKIIGKWLIDATGRKNIVLNKRLQNCTREHDDKLLAFYCVYASNSTEEEIKEKGEDNFNATLVEAVEDGWWYTSHLPNNQRIVIYHTDDNLPSAKEARTGKGFLSKLQETKHIYKVLENYHYETEDELRPICTLASSSYYTRDARVYSEEKLLAVGDAAQAFDPLSSQGIMTALLSGVYCANIVNRCLKNPDSNLANIEFYFETLNNIYNEYLDKRFYYYSTESRFSDHPFWQKRNQAK